MGILELHFHDAEFNWSVGTGSGTERRLSMRTGRRSESGGSQTPSLAPKLRSFAVLAAVVGVGIAVNRLRSRRARRRAEAESAEGEASSRRRWLSRSE